MKINVKSLFKEVMIAVVLVLVISNVMSYLRQPEVTFSQWKPLNAPLLDGGVFTPKHHGPLVVHFWATWCPTCKLEASNIDTIARLYDVLSVAVNSGSDEAVKAFMQERGLDFDVINDYSGKFAAQFHVEAYPTTFIYDSEGKLQFTEVGYTSTAGLLARLKLIE